MKFKLERLHEYLIPALTILVGVGLAIYCGRLTGKGQMGTLSAILLGCIGVGMTLWLKQRVWLCLPFIWTWSGSIPVLPLPFSVSNIGVMFVFAVSLLLRALHVTRRKGTFGVLDVVLLVNLFYLATVFVRNPVGLQAWGSAKVGGRPYFEIAVGLFAYLILNRVSMSPREGGIVVILNLVAGFLQMLLGSLTHFLPWTVPLVAMYYTGVQTESFGAEDRKYNVTGATSGRHVYLTSFAIPWVTALVVRFRPLTLINPLYFWRCCLFGFGIILILLSGFRSGILYAGIVFLMSSYFRQGWIDIVRAVAIGIPLLAVLCMAQGRMFNLPMQAQRALSFLPGAWSYEAVSGAQNSTEWRIQMWKEMLSSDKYIKHRWLGDGFGFSPRELAIMAENVKYGVYDQESTMMMGGVHSGPISSIRYIGIVGFILYMTLMIWMSRRCWELVRRSEDTPFRIPFLFLSLPIIVEPFFFVVIFGGLDSSFPRTLYWLGLVKLMENSLSDWQRGQKRKQESQERPKRSWERVLELEPAGASR